MPAGTRATMESMSIATQDRERAAKRTYILYAVAAVDAPDGALVARFKVGSRGEESQRLNPVQRFTAATKSPTIQSLERGGRRRARLGCRHHLQVG